MTNQKENELLDCISCPGKGTVKVINEKEAVCKACGEVFDAKEESEVAIDVKKEVVETKVVEPPLIAPTVELTVLEAIPGYVRRSRAWQWAHVLKKTGNPFKKGSIYHDVFNIFVKPCTAEQALVNACKIHPPKLAMMLTVYEVVYWGLCAGLLLFNEKNREISIYYGDTPKPKAPQW